ncbi:LytR family transcriptional regulator [Lachnospiraceae bacterium]|nr:LytR family transcriptional regulator [Lachnospiraceae bacterium]
MERRDRKRKKKIFWGVLLGIFFCSTTIFVSFEIMRAVGKSRLYGRAEAAAPDMGPVTAKEALTEEEEDKWQEGWVKYQGKIYAYNEDIMTFLFMGIDKDSEVEAVEEGTDGGQADALFLAVMNPREKTIKIIGINRNTIADVDIYNKEGAYVTTKKAQIAVQHGFGNGVEESCEYQRKAVSRLFYGLPIHGYAAIQMSAIPTINDAVGGVDVTVLEDLSIKDGMLIKGANVHLMGKTAFWYVKYRDTNTFGSADMRLERQKQYLTGFMDAAKQAAKENIAVAAELYQAIMPMMVTDISLEEAAYLAPVLLDYRSGGKEGFYMLEGETVMGEVFEEFHVDEDALYEMILDIFYEPVEG